MNQQNRLIVLLDDDFIRENDLKGLLEKAGYKAEVLPASMESVAKLSALAPTIIITDLNHGNERNPLDIIAAIKAEEKLKQAEIFVYSEKIEVKDEIGLRKLKINSYFTHSSDQTLIVNGVRHHFEWLDSPQEAEPLAVDTDYFDQQPPPGAYAPQPTQKQNKKEIRQVLEVTQAENFSDTTEDLQDFLKEYKGALGDKLGEIFEGGEGGSIFDEGAEPAREDREPAQEDQPPFDRGMALFDEGQTEQAIEMFEKAAQTPETRLKSLNMLGAAYKKTGDLEKALQSYKTGHQEARDNATRLDFHYEIADTYMAQGKLKEAYKLFADIYKIDKAFRDTRAKLLEIKSSIESAKKG